MFRGFFTAASGMIAEQRRTDLLTNNMSNANTPGYKEDQTSLRAFPEMLLNLLNKQASTGPRVGALNTGVYLQEAVPKFIQGDLQQTGNNTDMALVDINMPVNNATKQKGEVFFTVQDQNGKPRYTRDGNFTLDQQGYLTTGDGLYILDQNGKHIQLNNDQFTVSNTGKITGQNGMSKQLGIAFANNPDQQLIKEGDGLFSTQNGAALPNAANQPSVQFKLQQGFLEQSNVDLTKAMTDMLTNYRSFEENSKVLQTYDKSMDLAVNQVGKIS